MFAVFDANEGQFSPALILDGPRVKRRKSCEEYPNKL